MSILVIIIIISASVNDHNLIIRALPDMALKLASWPVVMISRLATLSGRALSLRTMYIYLSLAATGSRTATHIRQPVQSPVQYARYATSSGNGEQLFTAWVSAKSTPYSASASMPLPLLQAPSCPRSCWLT
jgi:hypothetical protein